MNSGRHKKSDDLNDSVVEHVRLYRMTIPEAAAQSLNQPLPVIKGAIDSLLRRGTLGNAPLYHNVNYVFVRKEKHRHKHTSNQLSDRSAIVSLATLLFCCNKDQKRELLRADDFKKYFPDLYRPQHDRRYFIDHKADEPRLGFLRIDCGGSGRWSRIIDKSRRDFEAHRKDSAYAELIKQGLFEVHIIAPTARKALRIQQAIPQTRKRSDEAIGVTAIPELIHLMLSQPHFPPPVVGDQFAPAGAGKKSPLRLLANRRRKGL